MQQATLGGGCFWCLEAIYQEVKGVTGVVSGYAGGTKDNPTYEQTYYSNTGEAEVVQITFGPSAVSYRQLLEIFYYIHNPTTPNQQGYDKGAEYRSIIFYHDEEQRVVAEEVTKTFAPTLWDDPIVTEIVPFTKFWTAEEFHQNFYKNNPEAGYCQVIINPKLAKFREHFKDLLK